MKYHSVDFGTAIEQLSKKYGVHMEATSSYSDVSIKKYDRLYQLMNDATEYFADKIFQNEGKEAFEYLYKRGFKADFIKNNNIGFSGTSWDEIISHLVEKGYSLEDLIDTGLIKKGDRGYYATFRNRIMFPIKNSSDKIVAFGGRTLETDSNTAKYLNSPETVIYHKSRTLYGIKQKGSLIRKKSYAILMEGYLDVLKAHSYGFDVALASLGTAFTTEQAELLKRYTSNVIIAFDMDNAGRQAVERTSFVLKEYGFNIRVLEYKDAKDPDEFLSKFGKEKFLECVRDSKEIFDFLYSYYSKSFNLDDLMSKQNFINSFKEFFLSIDSDLEKNLYLDRLSGNLSLDKNILYEELIKNNKKIHKKNFVKEYNISTPFKKEHKTEKINKLEEESLKLLLSFFDFAYFLKDKKIKNSLLKKVIDLILEEGTKIENNRFLLESELFNDEEKQNLFEYIALTLTLDNKNIQSLYIELFISWFRLELGEAISQAKKEKQILKMLELKKIEDSLNSTYEVNESFVKNLYKNFKNLF
jgi:DNA primase